MGEVQQRKLCGKRYGCCDSKCGCCCCGCCICVAVALLLLVIVILILLFGATWPATDFTNVEYTASDGTTIYAYLAQPAGSDSFVPGTAPAAIVFHAWSGMSEENVFFADKLADNGYYAIAPDLFRNVASDQSNIVRGMYNSISGDQDRMDSDADKALEYLSAITQVNTSRISSGPGFCFGGNQALMFGARHPMAATISLYGSYIAELSDPNGGNWGSLGEGGPVLGIYGADDTRPSPDEVAAFEAALEARGAPHEIKIYSGVGHAFVTPELYREGSEQAVAAWAKVVAFLGGGPATRRVSEFAPQPRQHARHGSARGWLSHRVLCALKCALDMLTGTGHWRHGGLPTFGLEKLLSSL